MKYVVPIILVVIAIGLFVTYINPAYQQVKVLQVQAGQYDQALNNSKQLQSVRDGLLSKYNTFRADDLAKLQKLLPDTVDNVRLILDINGIASKYGMVIRNVVISDNSVSPSGAVQIGGDKTPYQSLTLQFAVNASYSNFVSFLQDLEQSLRIVDVIGISFNSDQADSHQYNLTLKTYWLKQQ